MKKTFSFILLSGLVASGLVACGNHQEEKLTGTWIEQLPQGMDFTQGFLLKSDGTAESVGMSTLLYHRWEVSDKQLVLHGESVGNHQTISFTDTLKIMKLRNDTLVVDRKGMEMVFVKESSGGTDGTGETGETCKTGGTD